MSAKRIATCLLVLGAALIAPTAQASAATDAPAWRLDGYPLPTNFAPGSEGNKILLIATNIGGASTNAPITLTDTLPEGLTPTFAAAGANDPGAAKGNCEISGRTVTCTVPANQVTGSGDIAAGSTKVTGLTTTTGTFSVGREIQGTGIPAGTTIVSKSATELTLSNAATLTATGVELVTPGPIAPGYQLEATVSVKAASLPDGTPLTDQASISGGGASDVALQTQLRVSSQVAPFDFLQGAAGFSAPLTQADGAAATQAGSHPYQQTVNLSFPTERVKGTLGAAGHLRDAGSELPRGMVIDPTATPVLCTEAQLSSGACPAESVVGTATVITVTGGPQGSTTPLFNMVPPPGMPAELAFDATNVGILVHVAGSVKSDGDYGLSGESRDALALTFHPVFGVRLDLWGDPSSPSHDPIRGFCGNSNADDSCHVEPQSTPFLTLPVECPGHPTTTVAHADSWEAPKDLKTATYESADLAGNPVSVDGCNQLDFKPTIESKPTTDLADSPSGLDFHLHQPQNSNLESLASAALRDATVTLPQGMSANPAQADGLSACSPEQIGLLTPLGQSTAIHLSRQPQSCPEASKLGSVEVKTPLLAQLGAGETKPLRDPEGKVIPRTLTGSVFLAEPFANPFDSLIAIYLAIEDPQSGTIAKLAGQVIPDPITGQLKTVFKENPQLPLEDVSLHLFGGARAPLITPINCGTHTTTSKLTPWSSPEGKDESPSDSFQTTSAPDGGSCPSSEGDAQNSPSFSAGTIAPVAGAYSPFILKLSRNDGSQRLAKIEATLPKGLAAKFAGVAQCSEAQIAQAKAREKPNQGILERQSPSCPDSSKVGTVDVAAGAGPTPFHTEGTAYLSGPYKGAPLSMVIITPAIAGPFDLGAVVVRTALYVDPETAQGKAVSDPLPTILEGIPLDVRSIAVKLDRPDFTLNPTSCDPMSVLGSATSSLGTSASLTNPFQVGGCSQLPFKPKLSLKLKGGTKRASHPKLIATLKAKPGEANIASAQVKLPPSAFLDQAHIRTICTRVQFAANTCPKGSIYGEASATTPLLDQPLSGNVYLRSSNHKLPDLVVALKGPASLPIEIDLAGKTDSVKGALRNTFEAVPDAPVTSFRLELFGGKRGLVVNSRNLCAHAYKAEVKLDGQNGKVFDTNPAVGTDCAKGRKKGSKGRHRH